MIYYIQYKHTGTLIFNFTNQNLKLRLYNESQRVSISGFIKQLNEKSIIEKSLANEESSV